jgi:Tol biopolymer transport system component
LRSIRILPLLAMVPLLGCDGAGDWLRRPAAGTVYAAPLAGDTATVTTRRVWVRSAAPKGGSNIGGISYGAILPNGTGFAATDWNTGNPAVFDLARRELRGFRLNDEAYDPGVALDPVASPDGTRIMFHWAGSEDSLRILDVATGESRTILAPDTANGGILPGAWNPAGDSVFAWMFGPPYSRDDVDILLIPAAGGTPRRVHTMPPILRMAMSLSPDGRWLAHSHELLGKKQSQSNIYIIDVQGGGARPLVEHPAVDQLVGWLPGTDIVLFSSDRSGTTDLWSVRVVDGRAGADPRLVRPGFFRARSVGFADGALFYSVATGSSGPAVIDVDPNSGALLGRPSPPLEHMNTLPGAQAWSPDGLILAAPTSDRGRSAITLHSMETGDSGVFQLDEDAHALAVQWAADGKSLFLRVVERAVLTGPHHFLRLDLVTGTTTQLFAAADPEGPGPYRQFLATPDGRSLVLRQQHALDDARTETRLIHRSLADGSEQVLHHTPGFIPEFSLSADGTQLAFVQQVWEKSDSLLIISMDGSQPLRSVANWDYDAVSLLGWLPTGDALLAARMTEDGTREEILRIELDGAVTVSGISPFPPTRGARVQGGNRSRLVLSPAGNRLAHHASDRGEELWRMDGLHALFAREPAGRR